MAAVAARSALRSATSRLSAGLKPRAAPSPFRISSQKPLSARIFRSPVEMSSVSVVSMSPFHSATASAVLTSMLAVAPRGHGWSIEGAFRDTVIVPWMLMDMFYYYHRHFRSLLCSSPSCLAILC